MEYVLKKKPVDLIKYPLYYMGSWTDTDDIKKAKKYTLDDAIEQARNLKEFGEHYIVVRVNLCV